MLIAMCVGAVTLASARILKRHNQRHEDIVPIPEHKEEEVAWPHRMTPT
jgi:hypothetical protein